MLEVLEELDYNLVLLDQQYITPVVVVVVLEYLEMLMSVLRGDKEEAAQAELERVFL